MWFKNVKLYRLSEDFTFDESKVQTMLEAQPFRPCGSQEQVTMGWASPLGQGDALFHGANGNYLFSLKKQERLLPGAVVKAELDDKVAQIEADTGAPVGKKAQSDLKQEIIQRLLPQAFCRNSFTFGFINPQQRIIAVDAGADGKAEAFLAMLRKSLGSLPCVPLARRSVEANLTLWLKEDKPAAGVSMLEEAEFKSPDEGGSIIRCKNQDLGADEIMQHLDSGKLIQKLAIEWDETLTCILQEDLTIKRLKFSDVIREQNDDIPKDQQAARLDADFALFAGEMLRFAAILIHAFNLNEDE